MGRGIITSWTPIRLLSSGRFRVARFSAKLRHLRRRLAGHALAQCRESLCAASLREPDKNHQEREAGNPRQARRLPREVLDDHRDFGTGGTCFSLTAALLHLIRALGYDAEPILADRRYGQNTHCALLLWIDGRPHLLDPGYLILDPVPLHRSPAHWRPRSTPWRSQPRPPVQPSSSVPSGAGNGSTASPTGSGRRTNRSFEGVGCFIRLGNDAISVLTRSSSGTQLYLRATTFRSGAKTPSSARILHRRFSSGG